MSDAAGRAQGLEPRRLVQFHLPRRAIRWALPILVLTAGLGFVPEYRSKSFRQQNADQANIKEAGRQLAALTRHDLQKRPPALESTQKSLEAVTDLGEQLAKKTLSRTEALKDLANMAEKLKDELKELGKDPAMKRLEQAARSNAGTDSQSATGLQKQMEAMQKQLGKPTGNPDAVEQFKKDLEKLAETAQAMTDQNSPGNEAERQKMSESLSALSKQAQEMGLQLPQLDEAIAAQAAMTDLEKMRDMAKSLQQLQQQMEKLGKDLAEQLKNGQPEAAQMTLQKMVSKLNAAKLSSDELQKLLEEVSNAVQPAGSYGQVAQYLKNATKQLQAGDQPNAAQSLASAAKELEKLMQQMGDAQELAATLENLNQASMCIGSGQGWRACRQPGYKPGGQPGSGVGTWAEDETGAWNGEFTDRWDNSGIVRDDLDPRGRTDRGEGGPSDALKPTKVRGQFSPGGQMPSITLRGVSIKGQSKVQYEEAATAAQSDAQSALSQEKVPRAYQGTVKDYFNDIKK
jgi:cob(I)alamin adenosyltransferase